MSCPTIIPRSPDRLASRCFRKFSMDGPRNSPIRALFRCFLLILVFGWCGAASAETAKTKQRPSSLKRPALNRPVPTERRLSAAESTSLSALAADEGVTGQAAGSAYVGTPPPSASFEALLSNGNAFAPDTHGAVGPNHLMVTLNTEVRIQTRSGDELSRMSIDGWWALGLSGISNVFDPRVVYDIYRNRWIFSANNDPGGPNAAVLLAVSATSDPTGIWHRRKIALPTTSVFADIPMTGFNTNWIILATDTYDKTTFEFVSAEIYIFNKTNIYAGGS